MADHKSRIAQGRLFDNLTKFRRYGTVPCKCREKDSLQIGMHLPVDRRHIPRDSPKHGRNLVGTQLEVASAV